MLHNIRSRLVAAPHIRLRHLGRLDERLAAHLDGLSIAHASGWNFRELELHDSTNNQLFTATVMAIEDSDMVELGKLLALVEAAPGLGTGLFSAFGWVSARYLREPVKVLCAWGHPAGQQIVLRACAMHQVDPGAVLKVALTHENAALRACALRVAGEIGKYELIAACLTGLNDQDPACCFWSARSAILLGEQEKAYSVLEEAVWKGQPNFHRALRILLKAPGAKQVQAILETLEYGSRSNGGLLQGVGIVGDHSYVPWLIKQMQDPTLSRVAGESFCFITGLDLTYLDLDRKPPNNFESGPNDDPGDANVGMDEDDGLPWPDPVKIQAWWNSHKHCFQPGVRYFMGEPPSVPHCIRVLREGYQRQRIAAAEYLCLLQPGTKLFPTSAPAWRQERWLCQMG